MPDAAIIDPAIVAYERLFGAKLQIIEQEADEATEALALPVDPELARLALALHYAAHLRVWLVARQHVRDSDGPGWIDREKLEGDLSVLKVKYTGRHLRRLLKCGEGIFWNYTRKRVYLRSWAHVAAQLYRIAGDERIGRTERNKPGARPVYVDVSGDLEAFEAQIYIAWFTHRENPTISRSELEKLFGRDQTTLRRWESARLAGQIKVRPNYAQTPDPEGHISHIPEHAFEYVAIARVQGAPRQIVRVRWRLPNTYQAGMMRQHERRGQAAKVRRRINAQTELPADDRRGGSHRLYFEEARSLKRFAANHPDAATRYVWLGENRIEHGVYELNDNGFPLTHRLERVQPTDELEALKNGVSR